MTTTEGDPRGPAASGLIERCELYTITGEHLGEEDVCVLTGQNPDVAYEDTWQSCGKCRMDCYFTFETCFE